MNKIKLRLTLDVEIENKGVDLDTLKNLLLNIASDAIEDGKVTGETDAEVEHWTAKAEEIR